MEKAATGGDGVSINIEVSCELCGKPGASKSPSLPEGFLVLILGEPNKKPLKEFVVCAACAKAEFVLATANAKTVAGSAK